MCQECVETRVLVRVDEDGTMGGHRNQQQQRYCHPACFMRGATAYIKKGDFTRIEAQQHSTQASDNHQRFKTIPVFLQVLLASTSYTFSSSRSKIQYPRNKPLPLTRFCIHTFKSKDLHTNINETCVFPTFSKPAETTIPTSTWSEPPPPPSSPHSPSS